MLPKSTAFHNSLILGNEQHPLLVPGRRSSFANIRQISVQEQIYTLNTFFSRRINKNNLVNYFHINQSHAHYKHLQSRNLLVCNTAKKEVF